MLAPNQILCLHDFFNHSRELYLCCEQHDCDVEQMTQIIGEITPLLPGKGIDFNAILSKDPIACDPLVIHCNRSIGQLDELFSRLVSLYDARCEVSASKRTTVNVPPDWANPSFHDGQFHFPSNHDGTEKVETTTTSHQQRFKILEAAMKCIDRSLKIQITLTHRKEKLQARETRRAKDLPSQPEASARKAASGERKSEGPANQGYTGLNGYTAMRGYSLNGRYENGNGWHALEGTPEGQGEGHSEGNSVPSAFQKETNTTANGRAKSHKSPPEASAKDQDTANLRSLLDDDALDHPGETESVTPDSTAQFGEPKNFTPSPTIAEFHEDSYPWRKELKAQKAAKRSTANSLPGGLQSVGELQKTSLPPSQPEAPARETSSAISESHSPAPSASPPDPDAPNFHQRE